MADDGFHARVSDLFLEACGLDETARDGFLRDACEDPAVRAEVCSLLANDEPDSLVRSPAIHIALADAISEAPTAADLPTAQAAMLAPPPPSAFDVTAEGQVGRYRLERILGEGGMGVVYLARQEQPDRLVALKMIRPGFASPRMLARMRREVESLGRFQHWGIAQIFEAGEIESPQGAQPYFVMEYVRGEPLLDHAERNDLSADDRNALLIQIGEALEHAHGRGVVHRDLKPGNILVGDDGVPKVLDFGIARDVANDAECGQTVAGELVGTVRYMSPEQASGDVKRVDARSDIYALGVVAYELLAGSMPYTLDRMPLHEAVRTICEQDPEPLLIDGLPADRDLETVIRKALEKEPERRYPSAAELVADLRRYLAHEPITARRATLAYRGSKLWRRRRVLITLGTIAAVSIVVGLLMAQFAAREQLQRRSSEYATLAKSVRTAFDDGRIDEAKQLVRRADPAFAGWELDFWSYRLDQSAAVGVLGAPPTAIALAGKADLVAIAIKPWDRKPGRIEVRPLWDLNLVHDAIDVDEDIKSVSITSDGTWLAYSALARSDGPPLSVIGAIDRTNGKRYSTEGGVPRGYNVALTDAGDVLIAAKDLLRWRPGAEPMPQVVAPLHSASGCLALSPDGQHAVAGWVELRCIQLETGSQLFSLRQPPDDPCDVDPNGFVFTSVRWSTDGNSIVAGDNKGTVTVWDRQSQARIGTHCGHAGSVVGVALRGANLISCAKQPAGVLRSIRTGETTEANALLGHDGEIVALAASDRALVTIGDDRTVRRWDPDTAPAVTTWPQRDTVRDLAIHGAQVAISTPTRAIDDEGVSRVRSEILLVDSIRGDRVQALEGLDGNLPVSIDADAEAGWLAAWLRTGEVAVFRPGNAAGPHVRKPLTSDDVECELAMRPGSASALVALAECGTPRAHLLRPEDLGLVQCIETAHVGPLRRVAFDRNGTVLALAGPHGVELWSDARDRGGSWKRQATCLVEPRQATGDRCRSVTVSTETGLVACGRNHGIITVWDRKGRQVAEFDAHRGPVLEVVFSHDGRRLASAGEDGLVIVWEPRSGVSLLTLDLDEEVGGAGPLNGSPSLGSNIARVVALAFSEDGADLVSGWSDMTVRSWRCGAPRVRGEHRDRAPMAVTTGKE